MAILTKSQILAAKAELIVVEVPEWGGEVHMAAMSLEKRLEFEGEYSNKEGGWKNINDADMFCAMLAACIRDANGEVMFEKDDALLLKEKSSKTVQVLFNKALDINCMSKQSIDDLKKSLEETNSSNSCTD